MPPKELSSPDSLDLEDKYWVEVAGALVLLPYSLAKKQATYPDHCIFEHDEPMPAIDRTHLCWRCTEWLRDSFACIAKHWSDLEDALTPAGGRAVSSERVSGTGDLYPPLPIDGTVSDVMRAARRAVWSAVGQLGDDHGWDVQLPADHGTGVLADWMARWHVGYLAGHPSAVHLTAVGIDLARIVPKVKDAVYQAPPVELPMNASCNQQIIIDTKLGIRAPCPGEVVAVQMPDGRKVVRCTEDITHRVPADQWFYTHANRRPGRAATALKKYVKARKS